MENTENLENVVVDTNEDYIETIKNLKANSVSKDDYLKIKEDNKKLLNALSAGTGYEEGNNGVKQTISTDELRKNVFSNDNNNLEYWKNALALRQRIIEENNEDIFLPHGRNIQITDNDINTANKVADVIQQCIDYADGDSQLFTNELQRRTNESSPRFNKR